MQKPGSTQFSPNLSGVYNAESEFDSEDSLSSGPTMMANSSPSQEIVVSSIENLRKDGNQQNVKIQFQQKKATGVKRRISAKNCVLANNC